jgi:hypothetical protein
MRGMRPYAGSKDGKVGMRTWLINEDIASSNSRHRNWLIGTVLLAWAVLLIPSMLVSPERWPAPVLIAQFILCGLVLGAGRQGVDVLVLRLLLVGPMAPIAWVLGAQLHGSTALCTDVEGVSCIQGLTTAVLFGGFIVAVVLSVIAFPTTIVWSRKFASLRPELPWSRLPRPRVWWHWVFAVLAAIVLLFGLQFLLGIPTPP